jgi:hypothetical protein
MVGNKCVPKRLCIIFVLKETVDPGSAQGNTRMHALAVTKLKGLRRLHI